MEPKKQTSEEGRTERKEYDARQIGAWRNTIYYVFALTGFAFATWVSRTPAIRDELGASTNEMGWIIFGLAMGSIVGLLSAGPLIAAKGARFVMRNGLTLTTVGIAVVGIGASALPYAAVVFGGLLVFGIGFGACDVAMNVEGTEVERLTGKAILTGFHAAYSVGTLLGALTGFGATKAGIPVPVHLMIVAGLLLASALFAFRAVPAGTGQERGSGSVVPPMSAKERLAVWREPRTLLLGIIILGMSFAEGSANDWLPLIMVDGYHATPGTGTFVYGVFVAAMTIVRAAGGMLLDRFGRVAVLRTSAASAFVGLVIVIWGQNVPVAAVGVVLWGFGAAFGFPVALSAAGDDPRGVAARVSAVATAGYLASLVGPPILGVLGESVGLLRALIFVLVGITAAGLMSQAARPLASREIDRERAS